MIARYVALTVCLSHSLCACALFGKSDPLSPRYYSPEAGAGLNSGPSTRSPESKRLRLGRVRGDALQERIVFRDSSHELGYYEDQRWTERPEEYLRRALARELFEERGLTRVFSGVAPMLEAELTAFEEIRGEGPRVRVQIVITLGHDRVATLEETITVERKVDSAAGDTRMLAVVRSLAEALQMSVDQIADKVIPQLPETLPEPASIAP